MKSAAAYGLVAGAPGIASARTASFPGGFKWGVGSAAAQVESRNGRGRSNWDQFIDAGHHVRDGTNNIINTDFENRFMEDFRLLSEAGVQSFRFSLAWPRIQPDGPGAPDTKGLDVYDRMIDSMLKLGIEPFATMIHWDLPVWAGDFRSREITSHMAEYADIITRRFGDRVKMWALLNEPNSVALAGYGLGMHAPGLASAEAMGGAIHHQNLGQGLMAQAAASNLGSDTTLTTTVNLAPIRATAGGEPQDAAVTRIADDYWNRTFLDPLYGMGYAVSIMPVVDQYIQGNDMDVIAIRPQTLGVNYYSRIYVRKNDDAPLGFMPDLDGAPQDVIRTDEYLFEPDGLVETLLDVHRRYGHPQLYITETGFALKEGQPDADVLEDPLRSRYLKAYLEAAYRSIQQGARLKGIYYWSATDNFEWAEGFAKKFGLIAVDADTLKRTPKRSLYFYGKCARANAIV